MGLINRMLESTIISSHVIESSHSIWIDATADQVYGHIESMPNKFPVFNALERWPLLAVRIFLIGGFKRGIKMLFSKSYYEMAKSNMSKPLAVGGSFGPFVLTEADRGRKYFFSLKTTLFNLEAGYLMDSDGSGARLSLALASSNPNMVQRIYWPFVRPMHFILAKKTLSVIKKDVEKAH